jgi:hypothetical protein
MIAIPAAAAFFGTGEILGIAKGGSFNVGLVAMPEILLGLQPTAFFGTIWYLLLFFAAFTSSVAVAQPIMAFLQDELKIKRVAAALLIGVAWVLGTFALLYHMKYDLLDQLDFWAGTLILVVFTLVEIVIVAWVFGIDKFWEDAHRGADMRIPRVFYYIMKYITPIALAVILVGWLSEELKGMGNINPKSTLAVEQADIEKIRAVVKANDIDAAKGAAGKAKTALIAEADNKHKDLVFVAKVSIDDSGKVTKVSRVSGDETLFNHVDQIIQSRTYSVEKWQEKKRERIKDWKGALDFELRFEARHVAHAVWLGRAMLIGSFLLFCILVAVAWKKRKAQTGGTA